MALTDPLDILLPSAGELIEATVKLLELEAIPHGSLTLMADVSQNVAVTDGHSVFVKVYRRKDGLDEPRNTLLAQSYGAHTPQLLTHTDWCSVWRYERMTPLPLSALPEALASVKRVHEATRGLALIEPIDYAEQLSVVLGRLTKVPESPLRRELRDECEDICARLESSTADADLVFTHADLQFKNMGMSEHGEPIVFDWEICKLAPVELELSKLEENLFTRGEWESDMVEKIYGSLLDESLLHLATELRYVQNLAFHLEREEHAIVQKQYDAFHAYRAAVA